MYSRSFFDLDGHGWQVMWMDPVAAEQGMKTRRSSPTARLKPMVGSSGDPELMCCRTGAA